MVAIMNNYRLTVQGNMHQANIRNQTVPGFGGGGTDCIDLDRTSADTSKSLTQFLPRSESNSLK